MTNASLQSELMALEQQYWQAMKDRDDEAALRLCDDPCTVIGAQGVAVLDRAAMRKMLSSGSFTLESFELLPGAQARMVTDDVAIIAYKVREQLTVDGKSFDIEAADSSTWVRKHGSWVCTLHTEAITGDPFGRARQAS